MILFQGIIIGIFIGSIIDYTLKEFDYYGIFEASMIGLYLLTIAIPKRIYEWCLGTDIGCWLDSIKALILIDGQLIKLNLDSDTLDEAIENLNGRKEDIVKKKTKLNWIKRLTLENISDIIESVEFHKYCNFTCGSWETLKSYDGDLDVESDIRPPSLDGLSESVKEMMDMKSGKKEKVFVERDER